MVSCRERCKIGGCRIEGVRSSREPHRRPTSGHEHRERLCGCHDVVARGNVVGDGEFWLSS
jgi:hypothetical protein